MLSEQILKLFQSANIDPKSFDHFDYAEAFQKLKQDYNSSLDRNPKKKKIIQQFIQKAYQQIHKNNPNVKKQKINNFIRRMEMNQRLHQEKLQAMRFINQNYDPKSDQLLFYPNTRKKNLRRTVKDKEVQFALSASRNYSWNVDENQQQQCENISDETPIMEPNLSDEYSQNRQQNLIYKKQ